MANINDPFRQQYREISEEEKAKIAHIKETASSIYADLLMGGDPRCLALARTKLEEAVFWATKGITS